MRTSALTEPVTTVHLPREQILQRSADGTLPPYTVAVTSLPWGLGAI